MAVAIAQICAERFKHNSMCYYVYQPTGVGDWYRWMLTTSKAIYGDTNDTYFALAGACRGQVYAGAQKAYGDSDANSGFTDTTDWRGLALCYSNNAAHYRDFAVPENMTHIRLFLATTATWGEFRLSAYADTSLLGYQDASGYPASDGQVESSWYAIPAGTTKVRISKNANDAKYSFFAGVDWINIASIVDPDTAGSCMKYADTSTVVPPGNWGSPLYPNAESFEFALYWDDTGGAYSVSKSAGGLSHRGIDTAVITWNTQVGTDAPAAWEPDQGDKIACDYMSMNIVSAKVYKELARTTWRGTLTGKLLFDASGCIVDQTITVDQGTDMDVFQMYSGLCIINGGCTKAYFRGDEQVRNLVKADMRPAIKTTAFEAWGGPAATLYTVEQLAPDTVLDYSHNVASTGYLRMLYTGSDRYKAYVNYYDNTTTPITVANGSSLSVRYAMRLRDRRLMPKKVVRLL